MILEEAINFLKKEPPFQFLDNVTLKSIAHSLSMEFYPKDTAILKQGGPPSTSLRIIKKGAVKVVMRSEDGEEVVLDYKGEGDNFGFLSMVGTDKQRTTCIALDDTICYILPKEEVLKLLETNPAFSEYFMSYLSRYVDRTYREMQSRELFGRSSDRLLFTTPVGDVAKQVFTVDENATIQEAARVMVTRKISSLLILDRRNVPAGIITDKDLREKVVSRGRDVSEPVKNIMSISLIRVDAADSCFEAVLKMIKYNIHHMLVIEEGTMKGIMTNHDLMMLQGTSPLSFAYDIENQQSVEGLTAVSGKINNIVGILLDEGAKVSNITKIITEINDRLVRKVLQIAEAKYGHPPLPYCWIVFGSEGRREQTFKTDQDNAIIYADPSSHEEEEAAKRFFPSFTLFVKESLMRMGFASCPAHYMASNPQWCQPFREWKKYFAGWITTPTPDAVLKSLIFFDFRPLYGKFSLAEALGDFLKAMIEDQRVFLGHMANTIRKNTPPVGFLKSFVVEKSGEHKNEFNLKIRGITPLVDAVRLFALEKGIKETSTAGRISALRERHPVVKQYTDELLHAFEFIMLLRIRHQFEQIATGRDPDNFINPNGLNNLERKTLKEAFNLIGRLQDAIIETYKPLIV
jgi:CBS domain-containing protein